MKLKLKFYSKEEVRKALEAVAKDSTVRVSEVCLEIVRSIKQGQFGSVRANNNVQMMQMHSVARLYLSIVFPSGDAFVEHDGVDPIYFGPEQLVPESIDKIITGHVDKLHEMAPKIEMPGMRPNPFTPPT